MRGANAPPPVACPPGLPVFSADVLQRVDVHGLLRHDFPYPRIFFFHLFHPRHLRPLHPAVEMPPAMKRLLADLQLPANRFDRRALVDVHLRLAQLRNDLLRRVSLPFYLCLPPPPPVATPYPLL